ncbi:MAG: tyrosine-protein phosphatase [Verrucomicrobiota bacterium]
MGTEATTSALKTSRTRRILAYVLAALALLAGTKYGTRLFVLDNFGVVEEGRIYRSGQPTLHQLEKLIRTHGLRTVINLREPEAPPALLRGEQALCDQAGVRMIRLEMPGDGRGSHKQYDEAVAVLRDPTNLPVLVHCARGAYRSGAVIAAYRVLAQGWSQEQAVQEMERYRAHLDDHSLVPYLEGYLRSRHAPALAPAAGPAE